VNEVLLGGTFGKPISADTQGVENKVSHDENEGQRKENGNSNLVTIEGDNLFENRDSRTSSPHNHELKLPGIENGKSGDLIDDDAKSDNLSKLVNLIFDV
jgi:hypothetical protein